MLCVEFNEFKLARFYDKNIKRVLRNKIIKFYKKSSKNYKSKKTLIKVIRKHFKQKYGLFMILQCLLELAKEKKIELNHRIIYNIQKKVH